MDVSTKEIPFFFGHQQRKCRQLGPKVLCIQTCRDNSTYSLGKSLGETNGFVPHWQQQSFPAPAWLVAGGVAKVAVLQPSVSRSAGPKASLSPPDTRTLFPRILTPMLSVNDSYQHHEQAIRDTT